MLTGIRFCAHRTQRNYAEAVPLFDKIGTPKSLVLAAT